MCGGYNVSHYFSIGKRCWSKRWKEMNNILNFWVSAWLSPTNNPLFGDIWSDQKEWMFLKTKGTLDLQCRAISSISQLLWKRETKATHFQLLCLSFQTYMSEQRHSLLHVSLKFKVYWKNTWSLIALHILHIQLKCCLSLSFKFVICW